MKIQNWHYLLMITLALTFITVVRAKELASIVIVMVAVTIFSFLLEDKSEAKEKKGDEKNERKKRQRISK